VGQGHSRKECLPFGAGLSRIYYPRTFNDVLAIEHHLAARNHVVVIGGGFISLELAASGALFLARVVLTDTRARGIHSQSFKVYLR
jgi:NADPH-dependent 2,4-dienoyl-CoA reductase/sulfur reductase-like enzyme